MFAISYTIGADGRLTSREIILFFVALVFSLPIQFFCAGQTKFCDTLSTVSIADVDIHVRFSSPRHAPFSESMEMKAV